MAVSGKSLAKWLWIPATIFAGLIIYSFRPLPKAEPSNCVAVKATVAEVRKGEGPGDIVVTLEGNDGYYYINRGLDYGIDLNEISNQLMNKPVNLYYIRHWSLLNMNGKTRHVARIEVGGEVVYDEWE